MSSNMEMGGYQSVVTRRPVENREIPVVSHSVPSWHGWMDAWVMGTWVWLYVRTWVRVLWWVLCG